MQAYHLLYFNSWASIVPPSIPSGLVPGKGSTMNEKAFPPTVSPKRPMQVVLLVQGKLETLQDAEKFVNLSGEQFIKVIKDSVTAIYGEE